ncbi:hypothetical protein [Massilia genomosp. 1]|nr:hypothetical protein [Massilia genomosp. 1]
MTALAIICHSSNAASTPVSAQLNAPKANLQPNDEVVVDFTLTNNSTTDQYILKTLTPFNAPRYTQVLRAVPTVLKTCLHSMT